jgi:ribosome biogenesis GTPase
LDAYFPELRDLVPHCQFSDCTHVHEPGCAVQAAVETGGIHPERYRSYLRMRFGEDED